MRDERGFTLLEVLVALTILGVALTVLFGIFGHSLSRARETQSRLEARTLAASLIAQAETVPSLALGDQGGKVSSGTAADMDWRVSVRSYGGDKDVEAWPAAAAQVSATVRWGDRGPGQSLTLRTLRLLPKKPQP